MWDYAAALCPFPQKSAVDQQNGHDPGAGNAWYSMGKLGLAMKNREHLTPAVQMFMEYLPFREMAGRRMPVNERGKAVLFFGL